MDVNSRTDEDRKRRKEARRAERKARKRRNEAESYVLWEFGQNRTDILCRSSPIVTQDIAAHPPLLEEDITELPYAASVHGVPREYNIGQIRPSRCVSNGPPLFHAIRATRCDGQDLADALIPDNYAPPVDALLACLPARPRSRKDGLGASGWENRMQQWKQTIPSDDIRSGDAVPAIIQPLPGAPPLILSVPDLKIPLIPSQDVKDDLLRNESATTVDLINAPADLPKNQDVPEILLDEVPTRNRDQLICNDNIPKEKDIRNAARGIKRDWETDLPIDAETRHDSESGNKLPPLDGIRSVEPLAGKEEPPNQYRLYGHIMLDEILEDAFRNGSIAEDHRSLHRDDLHDEIAGNRRSYTSRTDV
ncbi:hypothetical protein QFC20_004929 [Naganishia adeliensis]|uniref:Uncharacterized protein n=1 Tax=Naganishia adeliensis TaxID=92952 RepID=A0ACC2VVA8_9TREE|nr:hypothetical protein QFC20_004929 [Naganishia adeliensis]